MSRSARVPGGRSGTSRADSDRFVLVDGHCLLCQRLVRFLLARDRQARLRFATLQSASTRRLLPGSEAAPRAAEDGPGSVVFLEAGRLHQKSGAVLRIARALGLPWSACAIFLVVPAPVRDAVYDFVARRRYLWFGRSDTCMVPPAGYQARFLDAAELSEEGPSESDTALDKEPKS